ncbi:Hypothetical predicted protein [Lecanosticta acicola]|uniref:Uncharacterized protein n=1 Tax=Lecanosticta acicola TaxID=111012 RepID=A0AAI8YX73_9PEZI|nr:Hypothetical predicted protein [Lecanosticta acicola]
MSQNCPGFGRGAQPENDCIDPRLLQQHPGQHPSQLHQHIDSHNATNSSFGDFPYEYVRTGEAPMGIHFGSAGDETHEALRGERQLAERFNRHRHVDVVGGLRYGQRFQSDRDRSPAFGPARCSPAPNTWRGANTTALSNNLGLNPGPMPQSSIMPPEEEIPRYGNFIAQPFAGGSFGLQSTRDIARGGDQSLYSETYGHSSGIHYPTPSPAYPQYGAHLTSHVEHPSQPQLISAAPLRNPYGSLRRSSAQHTGHHDHGSYGGYFGGRDQATAYDFQPNETQEQDATQFGTIGPRSRDAFARQSRSHSREDFEDAVNEAISSVADDRKSMHSEQAGYTPPPGYEGTGAVADDESDGDRENDELGAYPSEGNDAEGVQEEGSEEEADEDQEDAQHVPSSSSSFLAAVNDQNASAWRQEALHIPATHSFRSIDNFVGRPPQQIRFGPESERNAARFYRRYSTAEILNGAVHPDDLGGRLILRVAEDAKNHEIRDAINELKAAWNAREPRNSKKRKASMGKSNFVTKRINLAIAAKAKHISKRDGGDEREVLEELHRALDRKAPTVPRGVAKADREKVKLETKATDAAAASNSTSTGQE